MPAVKLDPRTYKVANVIAGNNLEVATQAGVPVFPNALQTGTTTTGSVTLTAAEFVTRLYVNATTGALAATTPTAAQIVARLQPTAANEAYVLTVRNTGNNTITFTGGTGVTFSGDNTVATAQVISYLVIPTNITPGSEAVTVYSLGNSVTA